jgi:hypothetical protein
MEHAIRYRILQAEHSYEFSLLLLPVCQRSNEVPIGRIVHAFALKCDGCNSVTALTVGQRATLVQQATSRLLPPMSMS